jgi:hypothetical protein
MTEGYLQIVIADLTTTADGDTVSWSQIQLTQTSTVQTYEPGPLFNNIAFKQDGSNFYYLGETTALAIEDTGQALNTAIQPSTSINSTVPQLAIPDAPTLTVEGTAGSTTATYGWVTQTSTAQGVVSLASNPGVNIGTMDIASGAKVELAAGTAVIGTVNAQGTIDIGNTPAVTVNSGSVDIGTISAQTLTIEGVSGGVSVGTHVSSSPVTASDTTTLPTLPSVTVDVPSTTRSVYVAGNIVMENGEAGTYSVTMQGSVTGITYATVGFLWLTAAPTVVIPPQLFPVNSADTSLVVAVASTPGATSGTIELSLNVEFSGTLIPLPNVTGLGLSLANSLAPSDSSSSAILIASTSTVVATGPIIVRTLSWEGLASGDYITWRVGTTNEDWIRETTTSATRTVNFYVPPGETLSVLSPGNAGQAIATWTTL